MGFGDFIPFYSTIKHHMEPDPMGSSFSDYIECAIPISRICHGDVSVEVTRAAELECKQCIDSKMWDYLLSYLASVGLGDAAKAAGSVVIGKLVQSLVQNQTKNAATASIAGGGARIAILVDTLIDSRLTVERIYKIYNAATEAKNQYCICKIWQ